MVDHDRLATSKAIQRRTGVTFHIATRFFPERIRHPTYVMYAFFRLADDVVDDPDPAPQTEQQAELNRISEAALGNRETDDPVLSAFADLRRRHDVPDREIEEFIGAMERDIDDQDPEFAAFEDPAEMRTYLRGSAVAVAQIMLAVMNPDDIEAARPHARALGEAFQLTNFLRDVREDVDEYGRIYIPKSTLERYGVSEADIAAGRCTDGFRDAMAAELRRAESWYREGVAGIELLPKDCQFPVLLAAVYYAEYHRLIRQREYDVLSSEPELTRSRYLRLAARTWFHWRRSRDPEAVFYRVSPVPRREAAEYPETSASVRGRALSVARAARRLVERS